MVVRRSSNKTLTLSSWENPKLLINFDRDQFLREY